MAVSRKVLKERLEGLGLWEEYLERREGEEFEGLRGIGLRRAVLRGMGLDENGLELSEGEVDCGDDAGCRRKRGLKARVGEDDISWIYRSMYEPSVRQSDAPNVGAWGWLKACREDKSLRQDFYRNIWSARVKEEAERRKAYGDDGREVLERIEVLLREYVDDGGGSDEEG